MFVKGAKFPKGGPNFLGNMAPGEAIFPRKFAPGGPYFGGGKFPGTPDKKIHKLDHFALSQEFCPFWIENTRPFSFGK